MECKQCGADNDTRALECGWCGAHLRQPYEAAWLSSWLYQVNVRYTSKSFRLTLIDVVFWIGHILVPVGAALLVWLWLKWSLWWALVFGAGWVGIYPASTRMLFWNTGLGGYRNVFISQTRPELEDFARDNHIEPWRMAVVLSESVEELEEMHCLYLDVKQ